VEPANTCAAGFRWRLLQVLLSRGKTTPVPELLKDTVEQAGYLRSAEDQLAIQESIRRLARCLAD
jgi:hypothetical protein